MERGARSGGGLLAAAWRSAWERGHWHGGGSLGGLARRARGAADGEGTRGLAHSTDTQSCPRRAVCTTLGGFSPRGLQLRHCPYVVPAVLCVPSRTAGTRLFSVAAAARALLGRGSGAGSQQLTLRDVAERIRHNECRRVVVMAGAGISTPSGIPDFRSPGSGLYSNLQQYDIPYPEAIFELMYFFANPKPFFTLAKELYPGNYRPNYAHYFLRLLHDKGLLLRLYTQNIDGLERAAGIPPDRLVEAHGTFATATCTVCRRKFPGEDFRGDVMADKVPHCRVCTGVVKPDIVFFGEELPQRFFLHVTDFPMADLLFVIGTSLEVWDSGRAPLTRRKRHTGPESAGEERGVREGGALRQPGRSRAQLRPPRPHQPRPRGALRLAAAPQRRRAAGGRGQRRGDAGGAAGLEGGDADADAEGKRKAGCEGQLGRPAPRGWRAASPPHGAGVAARQSGPRHGARRRPAAHRPAGWQGTLVAQSR